MTATVRASLLALLAFALFATHDVAIKILGADYATFQIVFFSVLFSFPLVTLMLMQDTEKATLIPVHPWWSLIRTIAAMVTGLSAFYAFSVLPLAQVYTILFAMPLVITVLSIPILGERVGVHRWAAVVMGLIGILVVLRPGAQPLTLGHIAALTAAFSGAFASIIVRKIGRDERSAVLMLYPMMGNFLVMAAALPFVYRPMPVEHIGLSGLGAVLAFVAGLCLISAYKRADAAVVAPMQYSQIVWASIFGFFVFGETYSLNTWIGAAIVIASGLYIVLREALGGTTQERPVLREKGRPNTGTYVRLTREKQDEPARPDRGA